MAEESGHKVEDNVQQEPEQVAPVVEGLDDTEKHGSQGAAAIGLPASFTNAFTKTADFFRKEAKEIVDDIKAMTTEEKIIIPGMVFFGDSLTEYGMEQPDGWITRLRADYGAKADLFVRGVSGYNSRWARYIVPRMLAAMPVRNLRLATIWYGTNDSGPEPMPQHVGISEYQANLHKLGVHLLENAGGSGSDKLCIVYITPPPVNEEYQLASQTTEAEKKLIRTMDRTRSYAEACCAVAKALRVPVLNLFEAMQEDGKDYKEFLADGLHLNGRGNAFVAERLSNLIRTHYPHLATDAVPSPAVPWRDINYQNPGATFGRLTL